MNIKSLSCVFLLIGSKALAQDSLPKHQVQFSLNSFTISDVPRYNVGYFYSLNEKYKIGFTLGFGSNGMLLGNVGNKTWTEIVGKPQQNFTIFEFKPEIQKHFRLNKKTTHFIGLQAQFLKHTDHFANRVNFITADEMYSVRAKSGDFSRTKLGLLFDYGMQIHLNKMKNFGLVPKIGVGIKSRYVKYDNLTDPIYTQRTNDGETQMFFYFDDSQANFYKYSGTYIGFDMSFDLSLFYRF